MLHLSSSSNWSVDPQLEFNAEADRIVVKLPWPLGDVDITSHLKDTIANGA